MDVLTTLAGQVISGLREQRLTIACMESCTGGLLASTLTSIPGASAVFGLSMVTYSLESKVAMAKVSNPELEVALRDYGVYSPQTAVQMAKTACLASGSPVGVGVTGTLDRPDPNDGCSRLGDVWYSIQVPGMDLLRTLHVPFGSREGMRTHVAEHILSTLVKVL